MPIVHMAIMTSLAYTHLTLPTILPADTSVLLTPVQTHITISTHDATVATNALTTAAPPAAKHVMPTLQQIMPNFVTLPAFNFNNGAAQGTVSTLRLTDEWTIEAGS